MADPNLIACLYPLDNIPGLENASRTVYMPENAALRFEPLVVDHSRQSSQAPEGDGDADDDNDDDDVGSGNGGHESVEAGHVPNNEYSPGLQLRFDDWRKNRVGFVFGTSPNCDIVVPKRESLEGCIAPRHCVITFDEQGRLILRDLQDSKRNKRGTAVTYKSQGGQRRRNFTWILSGHRFTARNVPIILILHNTLKFQIVVTCHDTYSAQYREKVAQFATRVANDADDISLGGLGFQSLGSTATASGAQTTSTGAILLNNGELGRGAQAVVIRVWDVSTGLEYASKEPLSQRAHRRLRDEVELLKHIQHVC